MEEDFDSKARLVNAVAYLHLYLHTNAGDNQGDHLEKAAKHLEELLWIQQEGGNTQRKENPILHESMILYAITLGLKGSLSKAIHWYHLALDSNPDKSAIHPTNLRALYNKGESPTPAAWTSVVRLSRRGFVVPVLTQFCTPQVPISYGTMMSKELPVLLK